MEYTNHPLVGEPVYRASTPKNAAAGLGLDRQFLHSYQLRFTHPVTGAEMLFFDPLPADLQAALDRLQDRSEGRTEFGRQVFEELSSAT